ncbi:MAG TPA: hypothetical protein VHW24_07485 [Bryobacteraceae bacterium]|nr:hypothetical protein [Bryobacteraceae bacterium]
MRFRERYISFPIIKAAREILLSAKAKADRGGLIVLKAHIGRQQDSHLLISKPFDRQSAGNWTTIRGES